VSGLQIGAVSFLHRFGSSLNAHFHYHVVVLDGVFTESEEGGAEFHEASELAPIHWQELQRTVQKRVLRYFHRHDLLDASTTADMLTWQGTGGFSIDASVRIEGHDRHGLERLVRYCARPPFALHRLHAMGGNKALTAPDARLLYRLPGPTPDGRTVLHRTGTRGRVTRRTLSPPRKCGLSHGHSFHAVPSEAPGSRVAGLPLPITDPRPGATRVCCPMWTRSARPVQAAVDRGRPFRLRIIIRHKRALAGRWCFRCGESAWTQLVSSGTRVQV